MVRYVRADIADEMLAALIGVRNSNGLQFMSLIVAQGAERQGRERPMGRPQGGSRVFSS